MTTFTIQQSRQRFKNLPSTLQNALFSVQTAEAVEKIAQVNHIPKEKSVFIAEAVGLVLLGFIHLEEFPREISERANLAPEVAKVLAQSFEGRIFAPLKNDIEKAYAPAPEAPAPLPPSVSSSSQISGGNLGGQAPPKIIEEIKRPLAEAADARGQAPRTDAEKMLPRIASSPPPAPIAKPPSPPAPEIRPIGLIGPTIAPPAAPMKASPPPAFLQKSSVEPIKSGSFLSELSRKILAPKPGSSFGGMVAPPPPTPPGSLGRPASPETASRGGQGPPPKPAQIRIGAEPIEKKAPASPPRVEPTAPRVIHYSQWSTPLPPAGITGNTTPQTNLGQALRPGSGQAKEKAGSGAPVPLSELSAHITAPQGKVPPLETKPSIPPTAAMKDASVLPRAASPFIRKEITAGPITPHEISITPPTGPHISQAPAAPKPPLPPSPPPIPKGVSVPPPPPPPPKK